MYPKRESETWPYQVSEARSYQSDAQAATPFINAAITGTDYTVAQYADLILERSNSWAALAGAIVGFRIRHEEAMRRCGGIEKLKGAESGYRKELLEWR